MFSAGLFLQEMLLLYCIGLLGFIARKQSILNENANEVLTHLILYITLPALIIFSMDVSFSMGYMKDFLWLVLMSLYVLGLSVILAKWMRRRAHLLEKQSNGYEGLIIFGNQGFMGYALVFILFGEQGGFYLTIFNILYLFLIWTYGIHLFSKNKAVIQWKNILLNPGVLATSIGLVLFFLPINLPEVISDCLEMVGKMTIPLSMIMIGSLIASVKGQSVFLAMKNLSLWKMAGVRLLLIPLLLLPFAAFSVPFPLLYIAVIVSGMPSATTISLYAQKYGEDAVFASIGVFLTTVLSMVSIPLLYIVLNFITHFR